MGWNNHKNEKNFPVASSGHLKSVWNVILDVNPLVRLKKNKLTSKRNCDGVHKVNKNRMQSSVNCLKLFLKVQIQYMEWDYHLNLCSF